MCGNRLIRAGIELNKIIFSFWPEIFQQTAILVLILYGTVLRRWRVLNPSRADTGPRRRSGGADVADCPAVDISWP